MLDQCAMLGISPTGNAVGRNSTTDLSGAVVGPFPQVLGWLPKGIAALAMSVLSAVIGMGFVIWYAFGGQLDAEEVEDEVVRKLAEKRERGSKLQRFKKLVSKQPTAVVA